MMGSELLIYAALAAVIFTIETTRSRAAPYDALFFFNISYLIYFVVAPLHVLIGGESYTRQDWTFDQFGPGGLGAAAWLFASYVLVLLGYKSVPKFRPPFAAWRVAPSAWRWAGFSCVALGFAGFLFYSASVGGVGVAVSESSFIRAGVYQVSGPFLFAEHLVPTATVGISLLLVARLDSHEKGGVGKLELAFWWLAICSTVLFVGFVVSGRRTILIPLLIFFALWSNRAGRWHVRTGLVVGIVGMLVLSLWDVVGLGLPNLRFAGYLAERVHSFRTIYTLAWQPITDDYMHWVGIYNQHPPLWAFRDWFVWPGYLVPHAILPVKLPSLLGDATVLLTGKTLAETAGEPPGFAGYFYMSAGVPGLVIGSILFGILLRIAHLAFLPRGRSAKGWLIYVTILFGITYFVRHGMLKFVLLDRFHWWLGLGILAFWSFAFGVRIKSPSGHPPALNRV